MRAGWGNGELQWYTSASANSRVAGGVLVLTALRNDSGRAFTSARLRTAGLRDFVPAGPTQLLRFEVRLQLPQGAPSTWVLHDPHQSDSMQAQRHLILSMVTIHNIFHMSC